jgi:hypothetical protein
LLSLSVVSQPKSVNVSIISKERDVKNWNRDATETLVLTEKPEGIFVKSTINSHGEQHFTIKYTLNCDPSWQVKTLNLE